MSHKATNWAIAQRGLKPSVKLVLWHLCDRHNPDIGCFPSQDQLAADAEVSRAALNLHLAELESVGLIRRVRRIDPKTRRQLNTRYVLGFEADFAVDPGAAGGGQAAADNDFEPAPCLDFGHGNGGENYPQPSPEIGHGSVEKPSPINLKSRVQNLDTNPVREPVKEEEGRAGAREDGAKSASVRPLETDDPGGRQSDDGAFEDFFRELLRSIGHDPDGPLPGWWRGWPARQHVRRWQTEFGFGEARILEIARASRRSRPEPPDGPKALDADMARAKRAVLDRASRLSGKAGARGAKAAAADADRRANFDRIVEFHADWVNSERFLPDGAIKADVAAAIIDRGLATPERLRQRGVR
ncbi:helix-turn-helix domain-containing protein [Rhodobacter sp. KR11]|uniref:helix-turn-helix domain-containing protein n=1 Tax=Rhodobacter sp. KR11 TaxID=2974588 RepID=UPI0022227D6D|nr:helix-turn-helix domain-containing protein [Rhodobacter sp. KR11]MCW1920837.1 helix-turn-helix domain-containing protein [Rhodobacter sp. KR11]